MFNKFSRKLGGEDYNYKWNEGAMTESGVIYCPPYGSCRGILKMDTNTDTVKVLNRNLQFFCYRPALSSAHKVQYKRQVSLKVNISTVLTRYGNDITDHYRSKYT